MATSRTCYECEHPLELKEYLKTNCALNIQYLKQLWYDERIEFLCCRCYNSRRQTNLKLEIKVFNHNYPEESQKLQTRKESIISQLSKSLEYALTLLRKSHIFSEEHVQLIHIIIHLESIGLRIINYYPFLLTSQKLLQEINLNFKQLKERLFFLKNPKLLRDIIKHERELKRLFQLSFPTNF